MTAVLLDTQVWAWSLLQEEKLSPNALKAMQKASVIYVSSVSIYEIGQKVRIGKWPQMEAIVEDLPNLLRDQGGINIYLKPEIALRAAMLDWGHRDPFDRMIAATALCCKTDLISSDKAFDFLTCLPERIW